MIYLDNAATTYPKPEEVYQKIDWANRNIAINAGRGSYKAAQEASRLIEETRRQLIELVHGLGNEHAVLLPSATIALNVILNGLSFSDGDVIYVSPYEHNAVSRTLYRISTIKNIHIEELPVKDNLEIDMDKVKYLFMKNKPSCVCCTHVSNVTGYILPVEEIFEMPETYNKILSNISSIDAEAAEHIKSLTDEKNFVLVINGMRDFNLHSEILKAAQKSLKLYGLPDDGLKKLNRALETAETFFNRNAMNAITLFEEKARKFGWNETGDNLVSKIRDNLMTDEVAFDIVNAVYMEINGQEIRWDEGLSASNILEMLISEYCGINGRFEHVILLFDEFGRYLEYASGFNAAKSGDSALQQIFETAQNANGVLQVINFIQSDIKTYLQRVDQTKNISRCM